MNKVVKGVCIGLFFCFIFPLIFSVSAFSADNQKKLDDFEKIILNRREALTGNKSQRKEETVIQKSNAVTREAETHWNSMEKLLWRTNLWKDLTTTSSEDVAENIRRLKIISLAFAMPGSKLFKNKKLRTDLVFALDWFYKNQYNRELLVKNPDLVSNIVVSEQLSDILVLLETELTKDQRAKFSSVLGYHYQSLSQIKTGNLPNILSAFIIASALSKSQSALDSVKSVLEEAIVKIRNGDLQYNSGMLNYNPLYPLDENGLQTFASLSKAMTLLNAPVANLEEDFITNWVKYSFLPYLDNKRFVDFVKEDSGKRNRNLTDSFYFLLENTLRFTSLYKNSDQMRTIAKQLLVQCKPEEILSFELKNVLLASEILKDLSLDPNTLKSKQIIYPELNRAIVNRDNFSFGISMFSSQNLNPTINPVNAENLYYANGRTIIYNTPHSSLEVGGQPGFIPGTTTVERLVGNAKTAALPKNLNLSGGVDIEGKIASVAFEYHDLFSSLTCKKSWFVFDNEVVALASNIFLKENLKATTQIDLLRFASDSTLLMVNDEEREAGEGFHDESPEWIHISHNNDSVGRGYYFPQYQVVSSTLSKVGNAPSNDQISFSIDHKKKPINGSYQYVLLPSASLETVREYNQNPDIIVIANNDKVHAVREKTTNSIGANFWTNGVVELSVDGFFAITCDGKASVIIIENEEYFEIALSDPTQLNSKAITIQLINKNLLEVISLNTDAAVTDIEHGKKITFSVADKKGKSVSVRFAVEKPEEEN